MLETACRAAVKRVGGVVERRGARCSVSTVAATAANQSPQPVSQSVCVRAAAVMYVYTLLLSLCVCALAAAPLSFRAANLTTATMLAGRYGKTVLAANELTVAVQPYADCVVFRVRARTAGYVALGFADPAAAAVDVVLAWVDDETGIGHVLVSTSLSNALFNGLSCVVGRTVIFIPPRKKGRSNDSSDLRRLKVRLCLIFVFIAHFNSTARNEDIVY